MERKRDRRLRTWPAAVIGLRGDLQTGGPRDDGCEHVENGYRRQNSDRQVSRARAVGQPDDGGAEQQAEGKGQRRGDAQQSEDVASSKYGSAFEDVADGALASLGLIHGLWPAHARGR